LPTPALAGGEGARCAAPCPRTQHLRASVFCFSLYLSIRGLQKGPGKISHGGLVVLESPGFFVNNRVGIEPLAAVDFNL